MVKEIEFRKLDIKDNINRKQSDVNQMFTEELLSLDNQKENGVVKDIRFNSIHIMRISREVSGEVIIPFTAKTHTVALFFILKGDSVLNIDSIKNLHLKASTHNIVYMVPATGRLNLQKGEHDVFYIGMPPDMFKDYFPRGEDIYERFNEEMNKSDFSLLRKIPGFINYRILNAIEEICRTDSFEPIKKIFLKAKVIELLSLQLGELCTICHRVPAINPEDAEKMYEIRDFILKNMDGKYTLADLAKIAGTNEYTLKKEFKELFGTTVFGFWNDAKMDKAQKLLTETSSDIKEISEIIGYKNPQHFTTAFKKKFGLTPSQFRKNHE